MKICCCLDYYFFIFLFPGSHDLRYELVVSAILLVLLIWALNRDTEISYRMSFHGDTEARLARTKIHTEKQQADWLLHNVIPAHVICQLKKGELKYVHS